MPFATFKSVKEVSSEDSVHLAENLIKNQYGKKWKTKNAGEKSAYVILEMSDCQQITGIDIGNEHSAFVEVLVGKSSFTSEDFMEILITCSFMTPTESKSSINTNRVRCFNHEALVPTVCNSKWSLVKILCSQPFNKHVSYGLSFIKIHINNDRKNPTNIPKNLMPAQFLNKTSQIIGRLKFREHLAPDSETENTSSLFNRWKKSKDNEIEQTAAASKQATLKSPTELIKKTSELSKPNHGILDRNRDELMFGNENYRGSSNKNQRKLERLSEQIEADKKRRRIEQEIECNNKSMLKSLNVNRSVELQKGENQQPTKPSCSKISTNNDHRQSTSSQKKSESKKFRPFNQLLKGVVLVISGIQNPDRTNLRTKAIALGAKYKADWDNTCTHLICAFKNTPKYNQVLGKGKIVTRNWIEKCYSTKKYLPWRRYALESSEVSKPESDEEIVGNFQKPQRDDSSLNRFTELESEKRNNTSCLYDGFNHFKTESLTENNNSSSSEIDTDDEIKRIKQETNMQRAYIATEIFEASTDEEDYIKEKLQK